MLTDRSAGAASGRAGARSSTTRSTPLRRALGHLAPDRRPRRCAAPARRSRITLADLRRRRARPARLQGELQRHATSSSSRPTASTATGCSSRRSRPATLSRPPSWWSARTDRCGPPTSRRVRERLRTVPGRGVGQRESSSARATGASRRLRSWSSRTTRTQTARSRRCRGCARRSRTPAPGVGRADRRRHAGPVRLRPRDQPRPEGDRAARAARDRRSSSAILLEAIVAPLVLIAQRDRVVLRHARDLDPVLPLRRRRPRHRHLAAGVRVHLPGGARASTTRSS